MQKIFNTVVGILILAYFWLEVPVISFGQAVAFAVLHGVVFLCIWATWRFGD